MNDWMSLPIRKYDPKSWLVENEAGRALDRTVGGGGDSYSLCDEFFKLE